MQKRKISVLPIIIIFIGVVLTTLGIMFGDNLLIFRKAIFICMECIGIA